MTTLEALMEAVQKLLVSLKTAVIAGSDTYCDTAITLAMVRANQDDATVAEFTTATEALLCEIDDRCRSGSPEWESTSLALNAQITAAREALAARSGS